MPLNCGAGVTIMHPMGCRNNRQRISPNISLEAKIIKQRLSYFGHVMRDDSLEIMLGVISGKGRRGRPSTCWLGTTKDDTMADLKEGCGEC